MVTLGQFKLYARVDHADEDAVILAMLAAAQTAVSDMTGKQEPPGGDELYSMAVLQLTAHWYENRTPTETGTIVSAVPFTLQMLLSHIALSGRYKDGGAEDGAGE